MAPEITVAPAVAVAVGIEAAVVPAWETKLARKAAKSLKQPHKPAGQIVEDLLARLQSLRRKRELKGLNHWEEFAPAYLQKVLVRHEYLRRRAVEEFFRTERVHAVARAEAILGDRGDAEDAVSAAFLKLLAGKTGPAHFYRVLSLVCTDRIRQRYAVAKVFSRERAFEITGDERASNAPACGSIFDGDPLEILLRDEAIKEGIREVKTDWKHRRVRKLKWWKNLMSHYCPEGNVGKLPAETNM